MRADIRAPPISGYCGSTFNAFYPVLLETGSQKAKKVPSLDNFHTLGASGFSVKSIRLSNKLVLIHNMMASAYMQVSSSVPVNDR